MIWSKFAASSAVAAAVLLAATSRAGAIPCGISYDPYFKIVGNYQCRCVYGFKWVSETFLKNGKTCNGAHYKCINYVCKPNPFDTLAPGLLENDTTVGRQGPAATGTPLSGPRHGGAAR